MSLKISVVTDWILTFKSQESVKLKAILNSNALNNVLSEKDLFNLNIFNTQLTLYDYEPREDIVKLFKLPIIQIKVIFTMYENNDLKEYHVHFLKNQIAYIKNFTTEKNVIMEGNAIYGSACYNLVFEK